MQSLINKGFAGVGVWGESEMEKYFCKVTHLPYSPLPYSTLSSGSWSVVTSRFCLRGEVYINFTCKVSVKRTSVCPKSYDTPGCVVIAHSRHLVKCFCKTFLKLFLQKVLQLFFNCAIIIIVNEKERKRFTKKNKKKIQKKY